MIVAGSFGMMEMQRLCLGGEIVQVPAAIIHDESLFRSVISRVAFDSLSLESRTYLKEDSDYEEGVFLDCAFSANPHFYFGNPISKVHSKIRGGWFNPERPSDQVQLRDNARVLYDHYIRHYYIGLLKKLLITRRRLIEKARRTGALDPIIDEDSASHRARTPRRAAIVVRQRAAKRARLMINECREKVGECGLSSDDEDDPGSSRTPVAAAGHSTIFSPQFPDLDLHQPLHLNTLNEMLREYQRLKTMQPESPSLDVADVQVEHVLERAGLQSNAHAKARGATKSLAT